MTAPPSPTPVPHDPTPASLGASWTVSEAIDGFPAALHVFFDLGIDTCWGGDQSLAGAASDANVRLDDLLAAVSAAIAGSGRENGER